MSNPSGRINFNGLDIPSSETMKIIRCRDPNCGNVHFIACNKFGVPICEMTVDAEMLDRAQMLLQSKK